MISLKELNPKGHKTTPEIDANLAILLEKLNKLRAAYNKPMYVTSGLRSQEDQARINPASPKSKHLLGLAADFADPNGALAKWCQDNMALCEQIDLYFEEFSKTPGWVHMQAIPPKSGKRVFLP